MTLNERDPHRNFTHISQQQNALPGFFWVGFFSTVSPKKKLYEKQRNSKTFFYQPNFIIINRKMNIFLRWNSVTCDIAVFIQLVAISLAIIFCPCVWFSCFCSPAAAVFVEQIEWNRYHRSWTAAHSSGAVSQNRAHNIQRNLNDTAFKYTRVFFRYKALFSSSHGN